MSAQIVPSAETLEQNQDHLLSDQQIIEQNQCTRCELVKQSANPQIQFVNQNQASTLGNVNQNENGQNPNQEVQQNTQKQQQHTLKKVKSVEQLKFDFQQNQKILTSLSFNIDDLFKKISSLTEQVQNQIVAKPAAKANCIDKIQSPRKKYEPLPYKNEELIKIIQPTVLEKFSSLQQQQSHQEQKGITMKMFEIGQSLGYGKFGQVLECRNKATNSLYALKKIFKSTIQEYEMEEQLLVQLQACRRMNHPNIIKLYTAFTDDFHIFMLMEYAAGNKLTKKFNSSEEDTSKIILQVLDAIRYMHQNGVVHRDLKPENIIIDEAGTIKICDFGWASLLERQQKMSILCGTLDYVCPEMAKGEQYTKALDVWSVGVLTYELIFGVAPFKAENKALTFEKVNKLQLNFPGAYRFSQNCIDFIKKLLLPENERISLEECFQHPFIKNVQKIQNKIIEFDSELFD